MRHFVIALAALLPCLAATPEIEKGKILGNPSAPIRIEIFSDFQCPSCKNLHETLLPNLMRDYVMKGKVYIVNREFPLPMHMYSREAANYATAAAKYGLYMPVSDRLFLNQASWAASGKVWDAIAPVLSPEQQKKVKAGAADPAVTSAVEEDVNLGKREKVNSTPTLIFSRGIKKFPLPGPVNYNFLKSLIDAELK
jgi:protein-disulfide isomerase